MVIITKHIVSSTREHVFKPTASTCRRRTKLPNKRIQIRSILRYPTDYRIDLANDQLSRHSCCTWILRCINTILLCSSNLSTDVAFITWIFQPLLLVWKFESPACNGILVRYLNLHKIINGRKPKNRFYSLYFKLTVMPLYCTFQWGLFAFNLRNYALNICINLFSQIGILRLVRS